MADETETEPTETDEANAPTVAPELAEDFKRLRAMIRGNQKRDDALHAMDMQLDVGKFFIARLDTFIEHAMGTPMQSRQRLDFELDFATTLRKMLDQGTTDAREFKANEAKQRAKDESNLRMAKLQIAGDLPRIPK